MKMYTYSAPKLKFSSKLVEVLQEDGKSAFTFKRNYKNTFIRFADLLLGTDLFVQYNVFSTNGELYLSGQKAPGFRKSQYYIKNHKTSKEYFISYSNGPIAPDLIIRSDETQYTVKQIHPEWIKFYYEGNEIARWKIMESEYFKVYLEIESHSPIQEPEFFTCISQLVFY